MEYDMGVRMDRIEQKLDLILRKTSPELFEEKVE